MVRKKSLQHLLTALRGVSRALTLSSSFIRLR